MDSSGNIKEFDLNKEKDVEAHRQMLLKQLDNMEKNLRQEFVPITSDQARFFKTKGMAFRSLWGKRLTRGLTTDQAIALKSMIDEFVSKERK